MGYRLSKIYTRTGDDGTTGLGDGQRVAKDHSRIEVFGTLDELNSVLGCALAESLPQFIRDMLMRAQHALFDLGGELCVPGRIAIRDADVSELESSLDALNAPLPPLKDFILPGGCRAAAMVHLARAVCRRAERRLITLARTEAVNPAAIKYLNRLSDLLFVIARSSNAGAGQPEPLWQARR